MTTRHTIEHAVLRVLSATQTTAIRVHEAIRTTWPDISRKDVADILARLECRGLLERNDHHQWSATGVGACAALGMGPANTTRALAGDMTEHEQLARDTPARPRSSMGTGDRRPPVMRPGAEVALALPSRYGNELRFPTGHSVRL